MINCASSLYEFTLSKFNTNIAVYPLYLSSSS
nr:MAG TPA: hypothetical protein [Crassvirales sp.]